MRLSVGQLFDQIANDCFSVAEEHERAVLEVEFVVDPRETRVLAALDREHRLGAVGRDDGHAIDGARGSLRAAGLTTSLAPITRATSHCGMSGLISSSSTRSP